MNIRTCVHQFTLADGTKASGVASGSSHQSFGLSVAGGPLAGGPNREGRMYTGERLYTWPAVHCTAVQYRFPIVGTENQPDSRRWEMMQVSLFLPAVVDIVWVEWQHRHPASTASTTLATRAGRHQNEGKSWENVDGTKANSIPMNVDASPIRHWAEKLPMQRFAMRMTHKRLCQSRGNAFVRECRFARQSKGESAT